MNNSEYTLFTFETQGVPNLSTPEHIRAYKMAMEEGYLRGFSEAGGAERFPQKYYQKKKEVQKLKGKTKTPEQFVNDLKRKSLLI